MTPVEARRVRRWMARLGVSCVRVGGDDRRQNCPFNHWAGIDWGRRQFCWVHGFWTRAEAASVVAHEVGHIVAARQPPSELNTEWVFLGWEWLTARALGVEDAWRAHSSDYNIGRVGGRYYGEFGGLAPKEQNEALALAVAEGEQYGNIVRGQPVCVR